MLCVAESAWYYGGMYCRILLYIVAAGFFAPLAQGQTVSYSDDVHPILAERCYKCHTGEERRGGLNMETRASLLEGGEFGPVVAPGDADNSLLIELVTSDDPDQRMPSQGEPLTEAQVDILRAWIDGGLEWDAPQANLSGWRAPLYPREVSLPRGKGIHGSRNPIDRFIEQYFETESVPVPAEVDDRQFARRAYLDLIGLLPSVEAVESFASSNKRDKHERLIDELLADNRSYAEHWMTFWNDALRNDFKGTGYIDGGRKQITGWLYGALEDNKPYDEFTRELIAPNRASEGFIGGIKWRGAETANQQIPLQAARSVSEVFLGVNLKCASCHDSFVDDWKLADAYGFANAFSEERLELVRCDVPTGRMADTKFLWSELGTIDSEAPLETRREQVAALVTAPDNGRYTRVIVNRVWTALMGRGLVEPHAVLDAEPWNEDLLDWLAVEFADMDYDVKELLKLIATSSTYRLAADTREPSEDAYTFAGPVPRRLTVEQFYDAMSSVTGLWQEEPQYTPKPQDGSLSTETVRAWRIPADPLMRALGRPTREQIMLDRAARYTRIQALELTNGGALAGFLSRGADVLLQQGPADSAALFMRAIGRPPTGEEREILGEYGPLLDSPSEIEDLLWLLFNHPEFQILS